MVSSRQNMDVCGYWSGCAVTVFYALYRFCTSELLATSTVLAIFFDTVVPPV